MFYRRKNFTYKFDIMLLQPYKAQKDRKKYSNILNCFIISKTGWNRLETEIENQERDPL